MLHLFRLIQLSKKLKRRFFYIEKGIFCTEKEIFLHREKGKKNDGSLLQKRRLVLSKTTGHFYKNDGSFFFEHQVGHFQPFPDGVFSTISSGLFQPFSGVFLPVLFKRTLKKQDKKNLGHWETSERFLVVMNRGERSGRGLPQEKDKCPKRKKLFLKEKLQ